MSGVVVVGACNTDLISYVKRLPKIGETIKGTSFQSGFGGKGANQAVMCANLCHTNTAAEAKASASSQEEQQQQQQVWMVSKVGEDSFGVNTISNFKKHGVKTDFVFTTGEASSGMASINVDESGSNNIIIVGGANDLLNEDELRIATTAIAKAKVLVCQLELPLEITLAAMRIAKQHNVQVLLNTAPAEEALPQEVFDLCDILCLNEPELELLSGLPTTTTEEARAAAQTLVGKGVAQVLVTLGERGSLLVEAESCYEQPVTLKEEVKVVDTTGAGDCFTGTFAFCLAAGFDAQTALQRATTMASLSVQQKGTQLSYPKRAQLGEAFFDKNNKTYIH